MSKVPISQKIAEAIVAVVSHILDEHVVYLNKDGTQQASLLWRRSTGAEVRRERQQKIASGQLGAVVHVGVLMDGVARITMIEIMNGPGNDQTRPTVHSIVSWYDGIEYQHDWVEVPPAVADRWIRTWQNAGREEAPGSNK